MTTSARERMALTRARRRQAGQHQLTIWLSDADQKNVQKIAEKLGANSQSDVISFAVRKLVEQHGDAT